MEELFKIQLSENQKNFDNKNYQIDLFRLHKEVSEKVFEFIPAIAEKNINFTLLIDEYNKINKELTEREKTYTQLHDEKVFVDAYSAFEKLLYDHLHTIHFYFPKLSFENKESLQVRFEDIFLSNSIENSREYIIEGTVKSIIQSNNIIKIIQIIGEKSLHKKNEFIAEVDLMPIFRYSKMRNLIIHNEGLVNKIFIEELKKFKIEHPYNEGDAIANDLETDIAISLQKYKDIGHQITNLLLEKTKQLVEYNNRK